MVDLGNRLTTKLLNVGTTSLTIYAEWPLDIEVPEGWLYLMGKLDITERGWHYLTFLEVDQAQGKATLEVGYTQLAWHHFDEFKDFEKKAFFAVRVPVPPDTPLGVTRGRYEEDDEMDVFDIREKTDEETPSTEATQVKQGGNEGVAQVSSPSRKGEGKSGIRNEELEAEGEKSTSHFWLYAGIILLLATGFYFLRKRFARN